MACMFLWACTDLIFPCAAPPLWLGSHFLFLCWFMVLTLTLILIIIIIRVSETSCIISVRMTSGLKSDWI